MSATDDLLPIPPQPEISEGNQAFHQKAYALYKWMREKLALSNIEVVNLNRSMVTAAFSGTSTSTVTITDTGEVSIMIEPGLAYRPGTPARLAYVTDPLNYIDGITKTYDVTTGAYVMYAQESNGSGEYSNWSLTIIPSGGGLAGLGSNTFVGAQYVPDDPYDATGWNGSTAVPTKNSIRNAFVALINSIKNATNDSTFSSTSSTDPVSPEWVNGRALIKSGTSVTTSGAGAYDFTGIPPGVKRLTVMLNVVSTNGSSNLLLQLGASGSIQNTGYLSTSSSAGGTTANSTSGFLISAVLSSSDSCSGLIVLDNLSGNTWVQNGDVRQSATQKGFGAGSVGLSSTLERLRITTINGSDLFDSGSINIFWEF